MNKVIQEHPQLNYDLGNGYDLEWHYVKNHQDAREYFYKKYHYLPDEFVEYIAEKSFKEKVLNEIKNMNLK